MVTVKPLNCKNQYQSPLYQCWRGYMYVESDLDTSRLRRRYLIFSSVHDTFLE
jgi:hypothetical protein